MTRAAELLHTTQSALSMSIKSLENEFGFPLFYRSGRKGSMVPSENGKILYSDAKKILESFQELQAKAAVMKRMEQGDIVLGAECTLLCGGLIARYNMLRPEINISALSLTRDSVIEMLKLRTVDVCISPLPVNDAQITSELFIREPLDLLVSKQNPLSTKSFAEKEDVERSTFVTLKPGYAQRTAIERIWSSQGINCANIIDVTDEAAMAFLVQNNSGISFIPRSLQVLHNGKLNTALYGCTSLPFKDLSIYKEVYISYLHSIPMSSNLREFISYFRNLGKYIMENEYWPEDIEDFRRLLR